MSYRYIDAVKSRSKQTGNARMVLLLLAHYANDDGVAWPGDEQLAKDAAVTDRSIRNIMKKLIKDGEIIVADGGIGRGKKRKIRVTLLDIKAENPCKNDEIKAEDSCTKSGKSVQDGGLKAEDSDMEKRKIAALKAEDSDTSPINKDLDHQEHQGGSPRACVREEPAQPTTTPPSFPKANEGEYLPGLPMPGKRREQLIVDDLMSQVKGIGLDLEAFREMVDHVLEKHGKHNIAATDTDFGRDALQKAQGACLAIASNGQQFWFVSGIEAVYQSWHENDWRWQTMPTMNQLVEHAGLMKAGAVVCQRKDKQQPNNIATPVGMVMQFAGDQP